LPSQNERKVSMNQLLIQHARLEKNEEELALSLGKLIIIFNRLERDIGELIATFLGKGGLENRTYIDIFTSSHSFTQKLDLLSSFYLHRYLDQKEQCDFFRQVARKLSFFEGLRNTYVHSWWGTKTFGDTEFIREKTTIRGRKGLKVFQESSIPESILKLCEDISSFHLILDEIFKSCKSYNIISIESISTLTEWIATHCSRTA
jgi:hypothetical protein